MAPPAPTVAEARTEAQGILRYWLAAIRLEEALTARPKARRPQSRLPSIDVLEPGAGQAYFRLGAEHSDFWLRKKARLRDPVDPTRLRFFERWLRNAYARAAAEAMGYEPRPDAWIAGWPALHFVRRQELGTLVRFSVRVQWRDSEGPWTPPTWTARQQGQRKPTPTEVCLQASSSRTEGSALPLSVDRTLLNRALGVQEAAIETMEASWQQRRPTGPRMIRDLIAVLEAPKPPKGATDEQLFLALHAAAEARISDGVRIYPVGLVQDALLMFTTFHLQRELSELIKEHPVPKSLGPCKPLSLYLQEASAPAGWSPLLARFSSRGLTRSQREAAEVFLGSVLGAVQGPPGTGKTELILSLAAHHVTERLVAFSEPRAPMPSDIMLVTSTNNRAVDNALDPLCTGLGDERLPLALRVGSQEVTASAAVHTLEAARAWLAAQDQVPSRAALSKARQALRDAHTALRTRVHELGPKSESQPDIEDEAHRLFELACRTRELWASAQRAPLIAALDKAIEVLAEQRSLRRLCERCKEEGQWILQLFPILGSTLLSLGNVCAAEPDAIDRLLIDEAGQCHPAYAVSGLMRCRQALLIGDVHQLPPVVQLSEIDEARVRTEAGLKLDGDATRAFAVHERSLVSAQSLADRAAQERPRLVDHFRCQPEIIEVCDRLCGYDLTVQTPPRDLSQISPHLYAPRLFAPVAGLQTPSRGSWVNTAEVEVLGQILGQLLEQGLEPAQLAVLTPYAAQLHVLISRLSQQGLPVEGTAERAPDVQRIATGTVHRFQGGERSVVLLSTVVTDPKKLAFIDAQVNLLNVAISRAKEHLIVIAHEACLSAGKRTRLLIEGAAPWRGPPQSS